MRRKRRRRGDEEKEEREEQEEEGDVLVVHGELLAGHDGDGRHPGHPESRRRRSGHIIASTIHPMVRIPKSGHPNPNS